jgi:hypothetical protein
MRSLLRSIIERANKRPVREKADPIQWHSCKEPDEKWRSIMSKYRSPSFEATTAPGHAEAVAGRVAMVIGSIASARMRDGS